MAYDIQYDPWGGNADQVEDSLAAMFMAPRPGAPMTMVARPRPGVRAPTPRPRIVTAKTRGTTPAKIAASKVRATRPGADRVVATVKRPGVRPGADVVGMVQPMTSAVQLTTVPAEEKKGWPKWIIPVGAGAIAIALIASIRK